MWRNTWWTVSPFFLAGMFSLAAWPALGDVIPISLSQSVVGTESPIVCLGGNIGNCSANSSSFSISNSTPGPYSVSKSDQATATLLDDEDGFTYSVTSSVQADQSSDETANSISVSLSTTTEIETGPGFLFLSPVDGGSGGAGNDYSFQFDLSAPSVVDLTGYDSEDEQAAPDSESLQFFQNVAFSLTGPGLDLDSTSPLSPVYFACGGAYCLPPFFNDTFSLAPGVYTLTASADASEDADIAFDVVNDEGLSLRLDFTSVPEPRWAATVVVLLTMIGCWAIRRKHFGPRRAS